MINKKGIIIGPWVGEFGWELFAWQAYCRSIAAGYDFVIAISRPTNSEIYNDFADLFLPFEPPSSGVSDSASNTEVTEFDPIAFARASVDIDILTGHDWTYLPPSIIGYPPYDHWRAAVEIPGYGNIVPTYKVLQGKKPENSVDVVLHARNREIRKNDNWDLEKWEQLTRLLISAGFSVGCIGTKKESLHVGGLDLRGIDLSETVGILKRASCMIGPSSGPMHLASLSGCNQVVWTGNPNQNVSRYKYFWNPFVTEVEVIGNDSPSPTEVFERFQKICEK